MAIVILLLSSPKLVLLPYAIAEALLVWSLRVFPAPIRSRPVLLLVQIAYGIAIIFVLVEEVSKYGSETKSTTLAHDSVFLAIFVAQQVLCFMIVLNSQSVLRRKAAQADNQ